MTESLFYKDSYLTKLQARIVKVTGHEIELDEYKKDKDPFPTKPNLHRGLSTLSWPTSDFESLRILLAL